MQNFLGLWKVLKSKTAGVRGPRFASTVTAFPRRAQRKGRSKSPSFYSAEIAVEVRIEILDPSAGDGMSEMLGKRDAILWRLEFAGLIL